MRNRLSPTSPACEPLLDPLNSQFEEVADFHLSWLEESFTNIKPPWFKFCKIERIIIDLAYS